MLHINNYLLSTYKRLMYIVDNSTQETTQQQHRAKSYNVRINYIATICIELITPITQLHYTLICQWSYETNQ